ncbi:MAG: energy-coupling factor transporter transmembrane component T [Thermoanaerobacteraceae bacterium]|nr:energy-coupling factor transporter transmembrane component T [Thermoanaerobacteraceae bacterium]
MRTLSLYQEGDSIIHKIDPITKIIFVLITILIPIIMGTLNSAFAFLIISLTLVIIAGVIKKVLPIVGFTSIILVTVIIIQGLYYFNNRTPFFAIGTVVFYKEGLLYALEIILRIYSIINSVSLLMFTTKPSDLVEALVKKGLSPRIGYVFSSVLQIIPQMMSTVDTIIDAQRSRGMEVEGSFSRRIRAFIPLIGPAVISSLIDTKERAMALEVRAFNSRYKKTFLNEGTTFKYADVMQVSLISILIISIVLRFVH